MLDDGNLGLVIRNLEDRRQERITGSDRCCELADKRHDGVPALELFARGTRSREGGTRVEGMHEHGAATDLEAPFSLCGETGCFEAV